MTLREYSAMDTSTAFIAHHGILGMHWGIRRSPAQLGHRTPKPRKLENGKTGDYKNDGETVKETYGKGKTRMIQSRNGETDAYKEKSKLVQIAEYHDKKVAAKKRAEEKENRKREAKKEAKKAEKIRRKSLGKKGRLIEDYQNKKGMSEEEAIAKASSKVKRDRAIKIGMAASAAALTAYGAYKVHQLGTDEIARRGGELVGKILGFKEHMANKAMNAQAEFNVAKQKAKLRDVLPQRENVAQKVLDKYKSHPEITASVSDWVTRDNTASLRFGSKGNSLRDLEEYLARAWPQIVKAS
jgi:hypothetical protein